MSEYRRDPITGRWRLFAVGRAARPNEYAAESTRPTVDANCPFCEGHENRTPPENAAVRTPGTAPNGPGWTIRSIPNRFPTVTTPASAVPSDPNPWFVRRPGGGVHEVIIESPRHAPALPHLSAPHRRELFRFFRERVRQCAEPPAVSAVLLFENWGPESGGTLWHPHAQIVGTDLPVPRLTEEADAFHRSGAVAPSGCLLEGMLAAECAAGERVVIADGTFVVITPFAAEHPYEMWVVPRRHSASLADASDPEIDRLSELLPALLRGLGRLRPDASYNWFVHGVPGGRPGSDEFHWHVEVTPRLLRPDGFEWGAGMSVNPVPPEVAAAELRTELANDPSSGVQKR